MKKAILAAAVLAAAASTVVADEIQLTNGRKIVGIVSKKDAAKVVVEVGAGTITLDAKDVSAVNPGRTALHDYQEKYEAIKGSNKASDYWNLAGWAREQKLPRYVTALAMKVVELEPEHAEARAALRHEKMGGKWLTYEQAQEARGLKWTGDRWVTQAEQALQEKRRLEAQERRMAAEIEREVRREEERRRREIAMEEYNARMARVMGDLDGYFHQPSAFWPPYFRPYWWAPYARSRRAYQYGGHEGGGLYGGGIGTFDLFRFIPDPFLKKK